MTLAIYSFHFFLGVQKHRGFGKKLLGTLGDALRSICRVRRKEKKSKRQDEFIEL
jgi:hypothetical protein